MPGITSRTKGHGSGHVTVPRGPGDRLASVQPMLGCFTSVIRLHGGEKTALTI